MASRKDGLGTIQKVLILGRLAVEPAALAENLGEVLAVLVVEHVIGVGHAEVVLLGLSLVGGWARMERERQ
jgi:predicted N-acetyltransferase YhbS